MAVPPAAASAATCFEFFFEEEEVENDDDEVEIESLRLRCLNFFVPKEAAEITSNCPLYSDSEMPGFLVRALSLLP